MITTCNIFLLLPSIAEVAQLVEHYLAKVDVESSSLFARSIFPRAPCCETGDLFATKRERRKGLHKLGIIELGRHASTGKGRLRPENVCVSGCHVGRRLLV